MPTQLITEDASMNYMFGTHGDWSQDLKQASLEWVEPDRVDYGVARDDGALPLSFLEVPGVKEGVEWYHRNFSDYPDYLCEVMAEYNWGDWRKRGRLGSDPGGFHVATEPVSLDLS
jgi:hypothetical protein